MSQYWLRDRAGGVLGPVSLEVIQDLVAANRLEDGLHISLDGQSFRPIREVPEMAHALSPSGDPEREGKEARLAESVVRDLERFGKLSAAELFSVPRGASFAEYQRGFLELAKRYHPARLRAGAHPALVDGCRKVFALLSERIKQVEETLSSAPVKASSPAASRPVVSAPRSPTPPAVPVPQAKPQGTRVELRRNDRGMVQLIVDVSSSDVSAFTAHRIANLGMGSMFLTTENPLPNGTRLEVLLRFVNPAKEMRLRGIVVLENVIPTPTQPVGMGIRLEDLSAPDRSYIQALVAAVPKAGARTRQ